MSVVDYFTGSAVSGAQGTLDGAASGSGAKLCFPATSGLHPIAISAGGYATYNGAIQVPGGATSRTVALFPVGASLAGWLALVNQDRQSNGAPAVQLDNGLTIAAWDHAVDMGVRKYYAHFDPHGLAPTTRSLLLGSMIMGSENIAAEDPDYEHAEAAFMAEKSQLPNMSASDCAQDDASAGHYCNIVHPSHNWVGLAIADVPGSPYTSYYDQEFGDLYAYYDTTVVSPVPAIGSNDTLLVDPAPGQKFSSEYVQTLATPAPISIATLNADPTCSSMCPPADQWYPSGTMFVGNGSLAPFMLDFTQDQILFAALDTDVVAFVGAGAYGAFWVGGTAPDSYGASSASYLVK